MRHPDRQFEPTPDSVRASAAHAVEHAIVVESLSKTYGDLIAVNNVSFKVRKGEVFAFLGPNGAGKTTTVEIIETVRSPTSGRVSVFGMDVTTHKSDIVPRIGVLPQGFNSFDRLTVRETIQYYARLFGRRTSDVEGLIDLANLKDKRDSLFVTLSGGMKQRLGIAIALVNDPELVFLDEPTTGLDPHARRAVWDVMLGLKRKGKVVFLTTHYMEEAELVADTVAIISKGEIVAIGSPGDLVEHNANYMYLTLKSADSSAIDAVTRLDFKPDADSRGDVKIKVSTTEDVEAILAAIKVTGRALPGIDVRKPNLEEAFLSLTTDTGPDAHRLRRSAS